MLVMTDVQDYWFLLAFHQLRKIRLLPALHCVLERPFAPSKLSHSLLHRLTRQLFFRRFPDSAIVASPMIERQALQYFGRRPVAINVFLPTYRREDFAASLDAIPEPGPFVIVSAGRIEENKGIFDIVKMAKILETQGDLDFRFDICGTGSALNELLRLVSEAGLSHRITIHGFCGRTKLLDLFSRAHAVIVPTRSTFEEGFAMICAEGVLAGRPVITSKVCPALEVIVNAACEARIDDPSSYAWTIRTLAKDPVMLAAKRRAALALREQFFDVANSYGVKLDSALAAVSEGQGVAGVAPREAQAKRKGLTLLPPTPQAALGE
jgi:glycosyltransferase involved in cell wall biosynthesis